MINSLTDVRGIQCWGAHVGIKSKRRDLALIYSDVPGNAAAVFTRNLVVAEPVKVAREYVRNGRAQCFVVNAGNANACTGEQGRNGALAMAATTAEELNIAKEDVLVASTGIIGRRFPTEKVVQGIRENVPKLSNRPIAGQLAANAILTTDTFTKEGSTSFDIGGKTVNLAAIAKGSGMIHPDMGTMLAFLVSDCAIDQRLLDQAFRQAIDQSFNMITVDGDTSTNDMAAILCNGLAKNRPIEDADSEDYAIFAQHLAELCQHLARQIISDGEGATKMIEYRVINAPSTEAARQIVRTVSNSTLVKCAIYGQDPNWGRILAAAGRAGVDFDPDKAELFIGTAGDLRQVMRNGRATNQNLDEVAELMGESSLTVHLNLNQGDGEAIGWGADLSVEYVQFNSQYST